MGRNCKVCDSNHKDDYDKLRLEGKSVKFILTVAHGHYKETNLKYHNLAKHFRIHLNQYAKRKLENKLKHTLSLAQENLDNLIALSELLKAELSITEDLKHSLKEYLDLT